MTDRDDGTRKLERFSGNATRRQMCFGIAATAMLGACHFDGKGVSPGPAANPPPTPTPAPATFMGAIYAATNATGGNAVAAFGRKADGTLSGIGSYATGGNGGVFDGTNDGLDPLISEDAIVVVDNRYLLVVNPGSNSISSLVINADFSLSLIGTQTTGGAFPNAVAYRGGIVYVSNSDSDGAPPGPPAHRGNITGFRIDAAGKLTPIAGSTRELTNRPSDIEFSPDGKFLLISSWNAGSTMLTTSDGSDSLVVYAVNADGTLSANSVGKAASTLPGNSAGRNLPAVIGFEVVERSGRTVVIASEAREFLPNGDPAMLAQFQTASVSSWELTANGSLAPLSQDVLTGPTLKTGTDSPTSACWIVVSPDRTLFWVSHASAAVISSFRLNSDGTIKLIDGRAAQGQPAVIGAANPLANADGFIDLVVSSDGRYLYQSYGLKGSIHAYTIGASGSLSMIQATSGLLPMVNMIGLVSVDAITR